MTRQKRIDSISAAVDIAAKAARPILVPAHVPLEPEDLPFWNSIIVQLPRSEWDDHKLELAAMLAKAMSAQARAQSRMVGEDDVVPSKNGFVVNPRITAIARHSAAIMAFRRSLVLQAAATSDAGDLKTRRAKAQQIEAGLGPSAKLARLIPRAV